MIFPHSPKRAVGFYEKAVEKTRASLGNTRGNLNGCNAIGRRTIAELPFIVSPHCPQHSIGFHEKAVKSTCGSMQNPCGNLDRRDTISTRVVAKLTVRVVSHGPQRTVGFYEKAVTPTSGNLCNICGNLNRRVTFRIRAVAKLTERVVSCCVKISPSIVGSRIALPRICSTVAIRIFIAITKAVPVRVGPQGIRGGGRIHIGHKDRQVRIRPHIRDGQTALGAILETVAVRVGQTGAGFSGIQQAILIGVFIAIR